MIVRRNLFGGAILLLAFLGSNPGNLRAQSAAPEPEENLRAGMTRITEDVLENETDADIREGALGVLFEWKLSSEGIDRRVMQGLRSTSLEEQKEALRILQADCVTFNNQVQFEQCLGLLERLHHQWEKESDRALLDPHIAFSLNLIAKKLALDRFTSTLVLRERLLQSNAKLILLKLIKVIGPGAYDLRPELIELLDTSKDKQIQLTCFEILRNLKSPPRTARMNPSNLQNNFRSLDLDGNGAISIFELKRSAPLSTTYGIQRPWDFKTLDSNEDSRIDFQEWSSYFEPSMMKSGPANFGEPPPPADFPGVIR